MSNEYTSNETVDNLSKTRSNQTLNEHKNNFSILPLSTDNNVYFGDKCEHFHYPKDFDTNLRAISGPLAKEYGVDFYFAGGDSLLIGKDGRKISISLLHAATVSPFLAIAFLSQNFRENVTKTVNILSFTSQEIVDCFEMNNYAIYEWIISKRKAQLDYLSVDCALNLLKIASFFQMMHLIDVLVRHIVKYSEPNRLIKDYKTSRGLSAELSTLLWNKIITNFIHLYQNNTYFELEEHELLTCLTNNRLNLLWQKDVEVINNYLNHRKKLEENKRQILPTLNTLISTVPKTTVPTISTIPTVTPMLTNNNNSKIHQNSLLNQTISSSGYHGKLRIPQKLIMAQGGWGENGPTSIIEFYDYQQDQWVLPQPSASSIVENQRAYHGLVSSNHGLMVMGGFNGRMYYRTVAVLQKNTMKWSDCCTTVEPRCYVSMGTLDKDTIMACGGYTGQMRLRTAEVYNFEDNQWLKTASMSIVRSDSRSISFPERKRVYMVGGFDGRNCHKSIEYYDPEHDSWFLEKSEMGMKRSGVGAVAIENDIIIAMGGFNGSSRLSSAELFDIREGIWHQIGNLKTSRSNFGASVLNGIPFVFGGYNQERTIKSVEKFEFRMNEWIEMPSLGTTRSALASCIIDDLDLIEKLVGRTYD